MKESFAASEPEFICLHTLDTAWYENSALWRSCSNGNAKIPWHFL